MHFVRYLVLTVKSAQAGREFLGSLVDGASGLPQITPATEWPSKVVDGRLTLSKPINALALGITHEGLRALGLTSDSLDSFPIAYREGAVRRADKVGDIGRNDPANWTGGLNTHKVHLILSVYALSEEMRQTASEELVDAFVRRRAGTLLSQFDGHKFPDSKVHFGYTDALSNPIIRGMTPPRQDLSDGDQLEAPPGEFYLGYQNQFAPKDGGTSKYPVPKPDSLGKDGSYAAFRVLEQDVAGFEEFLKVQALETRRSREWIAAKLVGRWRNGNPLELTPDTPDPQPPIPASEINNYNYVKTVPNDTSGVRCPIRAHMRRANPRDETVRGGKGSGSDHRIMRRAQPYGPVYNPEKPDKEQRGLIGNFIVGDLQAQFEFVMSQWVDGSDFTACLATNSRDPILSDQVSEFVIPISDDNCSNPNAQTVTLKKMPQFVVTRGGAYCFLPSLKAVRWIADLK
jgi:deferrochelatase/peroxidase EfeB